MGRVLTGLAALAILALMIGFIQFATTVSADSSSELPGRADGIVVFTGGQDRIVGAVRLLADGYARRLLISGVHPSTTKVALAKLAGGERELFDCCIDLGRNARDTIGNANETAEWARRQGFTSLIIVTSGYHMPRSLAEVSRALPEATLVGHAISTSSVDLAHWWRTPEAASLLMLEYIKLLASRARLGLASGRPDRGQANPL